MTTWITIFVVAALISKKTFADFALPKSDISLAPFARMKSIHGHSRSFDQSLLVGKTLYTQKSTEHISLPPSVAMNNIHERSRSFDQAFQGEKTTNTMKTTELLPMKQSAMTSLAKHSFGVHELIEDNADARLSVTAAGSPTAEPTAEPTAAPSQAPSAEPTLTPTQMPTEVPGISLSFSTPGSAASISTGFSAIFSQQPQSISFSYQGSVDTSSSLSMSFLSSFSLSAPQSARPTEVPTQTPTLPPTAAPTAGLTEQPTRTPSDAPTAAPTQVPTFRPTPGPGQPTLVPSSVPTAKPSAEPTVAPTSSPTQTGLGQPTFNPTFSPTNRPSRLPTPAPSFLPTPPPGYPTFKPTRAPTFRPTRRPSFRPTFNPSKQTSPIIEFLSNLEMGGLTEPELDAAAQEAVVNATAESMGLAITSVTYLGATFQLEDRRRLVEGRNEDGRVTRFLQDTYSASAVTKTAVPLDTTGAANATELYSQLTSALDEAVSSGSFTQKMNTAAKSLGATVLETAEATGVVNSVLLLLEPSPAEEDNNKGGKGPDDIDDLTDAAIAGIVIGSVGFVLLCVLGIWYIFNYDSSNSQAFYVNRGSNFSGVDVAL